MIDAAQLQQLRSGFRAELSFFGFLSEKSRDVLEQIVDHPRFPGFTDPPSLAVLTTLLLFVQPRRVLQLGTHIGVSSIFIADVLMRNARLRGHLHTVDPDLSGHELAREWAAQAGLADTITFLEGYSTDPAIDLALRAAGPFDFIYLDSSHAYAETLKELGLIFESGRWLADEGLIVLHDSAKLASRYDPTGQGGVRRALDEWVDSHEGEYQLLILEPPLWPVDCGLGMIARRQPSRYTATRFSGQPSRQLAGWRRRIASARRRLLSLTGR